MTILCIESSCSELSVVLGVDGQIVSDSSVEAALDYIRAHETAVDAVAVSNGPGSYTGLRKGCCLAKGVAYGLQCPVITLPTLQVMVVPALLYHDEIPNDALFCPMIDARRTEVYAAIYDRALDVVRETQADIVEADTYASYYEARPLYYFGTGAEKCRGVLRASDNLHFLNSDAPKARNMLPLAEIACLRGQFADTAYFTPQYGKDFKAIKPRDMLKETRRQTPADNLPNN